ncbi:FAD-dependent oxidoreductase [Opitutaceae bacterium TAV3]|nr:FAD-dependent oxidoreductase [Opitutaceae bacterium TAV3]
MPPPPPPPATASVSTTFIMSSLSCFDLVVYGATPGGIACAVRAAREGLTVSLVSVFPHLGGMLTSGLGLYDANYTGERAPLVTEVFQRILAHYEAVDGRESENYRLCQTNQTFEPHVAEKVLTEMVAGEPRISVFKGWQVTGVETSGRTITGILIEEMHGKERLRLQARAFVDTSYEGDLLAAAGAPYRVGRESRTEYGEPHAGRIFTRYDESPDGPRYPYEALHGFIKLKPFDLCTGRIFPGSTGEGDNAIQAYNFRIFLTRDPANRAPIPKPEAYSRENYLGLLQSENESLNIPYPVKSKWLVDDIRSFKFRNHRTMPNRKISWNHGSFTGQNHEYPEADWSKRREILERHKRHELGLLWFLQNDPDVPEEVRARACELGLARDEFTDNGNFPWEIYVREARRLCGRAVFTELDASLAAGIQRTPPHSDSIGITDWMMDSHECRTERQPGSAYDGAILLSELSRPAHIPFRCLLPPDLDNLLVPVCLSATHVGWGCIRLEPTWIHVSESAAWACVLAQRRQEMPAQIPVEELQRLLLSRGVMISFFNDFDMRHDAPWGEAVQFFAARGFFPTYNADADQPLDEASAVLWIQELAGLLAGKSQPLTLARQLAAVRATASKIDPLSFATQLCEALGASASADWIPAELASSSKPLTRGDACRIMYRAMNAQRSECRAVPAS